MRNTLRTPATYYTHEVLDCFGISAITPTDNWFRAQFHLADMRIYRDQSAANRLRSYSVGDFRVPHPLVLWVRI